MSNKSNGTTFEKEFAQILSENGFWVHRMQDNRNGQPFDVMAARNGHTYVFDCKDCQGNVFSLYRIEENQDNAMKLWFMTGNGTGLFAIRFTNNIHLLPHRMIDVLLKMGTSSMTERILERYTINLNEWLDARNKFDEQVKMHEDNN